MPEIETTAELVRSVYEKLERNVDIIRERLGLVNSKAEGGQA